MYYILLAVLHSYAHTTCTLLCTCLVTLLHNYSCIYSIYAIGDCIHGPMLAHKAEDEGILVYSYHFKYFWSSKVHVCVHVIH